MIDQSLLCFLLINGVQSSPFSFDREYGPKTAGAVGLVTILSTLLTCCCLVICCAACVSWCAMAGRDNDSDKNMVYVIHSPSDHPRDRPESNDGPVIVRVTEYRVKSDSNNPLNNSKPTQKFVKASDTSNKTQNQERSEDGAESKMTEE